MPVIPLASANYTGVPSVEPTSSSPGPIHVDAPLSAFGGAMADALGKLGKGAGELGDDLFARAQAMQQLENQTTAEHLSIAAGQQLGDARDRFQNNKGTNAAQAYLDYQKEIEGIHQSALSAAPNPMVRSMLGHEITSRIIRDSDYAGLYAAQQTKSANTAALNGSIDQALSASRSSRDESELNANIGTQVQKLNELSASEGWPQPKLDAAIAEQTALAKNQYSEKKAITDPWGAMRYYQAHPNEFGKYDLKTQEFIQHQVLTKGVEQLSDTILTSPSQDYDKRLAQKESGGVITAKSPTSSAEGLYQFTTGTWSSVRANRPELNLPPTVGQATAAQQLSAQHAFTGENAKALTAAGIEPSQPNLYMAHFLGPAGATKFLQGMKNDPTQPATGLASPAAVEANRSVFLHQDGSPKSAGEAYIGLTSTFMGPGSLDKDSDSRWLARAQGAATQVARQFEDFAPGITQATITRINSAYSNIHRMSQAADQQTYLGLSQQIGGPGQQNSMTDVADIMKSPVLAEQYTGLPRAYQQRIESQLKSNATYSPNATPERDQNFQKIMNTSVGLSGQQDKFMQIDPYALVNNGDITRKQADAIYNKQRSISGGKAQDAQHLSHALGISKDYLAANQIVAGSDDHIQFTGAMNQWLTEREQETKKVPSDQEIRDKAADLTSSISTGWFSSRYGYEPPAEFKDEFAKLFKQSPRNPDKREPRVEEAARWYEHSLHDPNWRSEIGR